MLDFRVKKPSEALNWRYQEIVVTEEYLASKDDPNLITLDSIYEMGKKVLDVYYNGARLVEGGGYEEVDNLHIRLDIRDYDDDGKEIPAQLEVGDEIIIKEWFNSTSILYSSAGLNKRLSAIEIEVTKARNYDEEKDFSDLGSRLNFMQDEIDSVKSEIEAAVDDFFSLDDRLDYIQELAEQGGIKVGDGTLGLVSYTTTVEYTTDEDGNVIKEKVDGDVEYVKDYVYDGNLNLTEEKVTVGEKTFIRTYQYDDDGYLVSEDGDKIEFVSSLTSKALKDIGYLLGEGNYEVTFTYDEVTGKISKETVTGDYTVTKEYTYNEEGEVATETLKYRNKIITKTYRYNEQGKVSGFSCDTVTI